MAIHSLRDQQHRGIAGSVDRGDQIVLLEDEADVLQPEFDQLGIGEIVDIGAEDLHLAQRRPQDAAHDRDERGLARAAFADEESQLARAYVEIDAMQHGDGLLAGHEIARHAARADCRLRSAAADGGGVHRLPHQRNTDAGSVLSTLRSASHPVSARISVTAARLISGICQGM